MKILVILMAALFLLSGCGDSSSTEDFFLSAAKNTIPSLAGTATASFNPKKRGTITSDWVTGNPLYLAYSVLQDFPHTVAEDWSVGVGFSDANIFKSLWIADKAYNGTKDSCSAIAAATLTSPFPFGITDTYDCKNPWSANSNSSSEGAISNINGVRHALITRQSAAEGGGAAGTFYSIWQGSVDANTNNVVIHFAGFGDLASDPDTVTHFFVSGNTQTHTFLVKLYTGAVYGSRPSDEYTSFVGYGVSQGAGNSYLFKLRRTIGAVKNDELYYCFRSTDGAAEYRAFDPNDGILKSAVGPSTFTDKCKGEYLTAVDAEPMFWNDNTSMPNNNDAPTSVSAFNVGNAYAGTIQF